MNMSIKTKPMIVGSYLFELLAQTLNKPRADCQQINTDDFNISLKTIYLLYVILIKYSRYVQFKAAD